MFSLRTESNPSGAYALRLFCDSQSLHHHSVSGRTSLSFGERPLTSCPAKAPRLGFPVPRGTAYPQVSPSFRNHAVRGCPCRICFWHHSATSASDSRYTRVSPVQDRQRSVAFPRFLPCGATRLDSRFFPTGASIAAAGSSAPLERDCARRGLDLGLCPSEAFLAKRRAACRPGYPPGGIRSIYPASEGCKPLFTEV